MTRKPYFGSRRSSRVRLAVLLLPLLLIAPPAPAAEDATVADLYVEVDGETAHGLLATPAGEPTSIVVVLHGYTHQAESHRGHLLDLAERGAVAFAMDYRGPVDGFPLRAGADDTIAALDLVRARHPDVEEIHLFSVSMGTAVASMVLAERPVFDVWVDAEGLSMLHETWAGATALSPSGNPTAVRAAQAIEQETGGTPADAPAAYAERSAALRAAEYAHLRGAYVLHGLNDGLVPYDQGREMAAALRAVGVPTDVHTVAMHPGGEGTTLTGYVGQDARGLSGHGTESDDTHALTALSWAIMREVVDGTAAPPAGREIVVAEGAPLP